MKTYWKVHTPNFLKELADNNHLGPASKGIEIFGKLLFALADRAKELNDEELNSICCRLTLFSQADPESPDYDSRTSRLIHKFDSKVIQRLESETI